MVALSFFLITFILFVLGAVIGSFVNVVVYRSITEESWVVGWSKCEHCGKRIKWYDNIPIVSFLILQGRCRSCRKPIALIHPVVEVLMGSLFVWWYWFGAFFFQLTSAPFQTIQPLFWLSVGLLLLMVVVADLLYLIIPDVTVGLLLVLTVVYRIALTVTGIMQPFDLVKSVVGMVLIVSFFAGLWLITKGRGMGFGDVKLVAPLSLLMGWPGVLVGIFLAFIVGAIVSLGLLFTGKKKIGQTVPFGPFLVIGTVLSLIYSDQLISWYLQLLMT